MNLLRLLRVLLALPGRALVAWFDRIRARNGAPRFTTAERAWTYVFVWGAALIMFSDLVLR